MSNMDILIAMSDGNPGAASVLSNIAINSAKIDPDCVFPFGIGTFLSMDEYGIYGSRIWVLYKDVCKQDVENTIMLIRCVQMGILSITKLNHAIDNYGEGLDLKDLMIKLRIQLPNFGIQSDDIN